eukprot:SAG11_NODE_29128_length_314_cov_0.725581_1_plen_48_part_10
MRLLDQITRLVADSQGGKIETSGRTSSGFLSHANANISRPVRGMESTA